MKAKKLKCGDYMSEGYSGLYCPNCIKTMNKQVCVECNKELEEGYHLSGLGTCPSCVRKWVEGYSNLHKRRRSK